MINRKSIIYLGNSGFPYGLAEIQKITLISKSLILAGNTVTVICRKGIHKKTHFPQLKEYGTHEGIEYIYTSGSPFRDDKFVNRNLLKIKGVINEFLFLVKQKRNRKLDFAILSTNRFTFILFYWILSKFCNFKIILNYAEYYPGIKKKRSQIRERINSNLYDKYAPLLVDAVFPISEFLIQNLKKSLPNKKYLKIPVLADFERYNDTEIFKDQKYFLFCGAAVYKEIIQFIIDSFVCLNNNSNILYLVINGDELDMMEIRRYIDNSLEKNKIKLFSNLSESQLNIYYKNAIALLIPLRPTFQDCARFPHKIGEYLATGNPIISTNYGEVKYYFKDMENMLIAKSYDINLFAAKMQFVIDYPLKAQKIGQNGRNMGLAIFDYRNQANVIDNFLNSHFNSIESVSINK